MTDLIEKKVVVLGDIHGHAGPFMDLLELTGAVVDGKKNPDVHVIQIGDLIHYGHDVYQGDVDSLDISLRFVDEQLYGNHDMPAIFKWAPGFMDQHYAPHPELQELIGKALKRNHFKAATHLDDHLIVHAGLNPHLWEEYRIPETSAEDAAADLNRRFTERCRGGSLSELFDVVSHSRGGRFPYGSIFWEEWDDLVRDYEKCPKLPQIVGHSARPGDSPKFTETGLVNIDLAGIDEGWIGGITRDPGSQVFEPVSVRRRPRNQS